MQTRRNLISAAAWAVLPASVSSHAPPVEVAADPPTIIQWLDFVGRMEMEQTHEMVSEWREGGMKTTLSLPCEARLLQFIDGKWVAVLPTQEINPPSLLPSVSQFTVRRGEESHRLCKEMNGKGYNISSSICDPISDFETLVFVRRPL